VRREERRDMADAQGAIRRHGSILRRRHTAALHRRHGFERLAPPP
jgi:hypothetical protein